MNKNDYLKMAGYSEKEWMVAEPEEVEIAKEIPTSDGQIYPINHRKFVASLGKGYALINKKWFEKTFPKKPKNDDGTPKHTIAEAVKMIDDNFPSSIPKPPTETKEAPIVSGMVIPKPPSKDIEDAIVIEEFYCEKESQTGTCDCTVQCDECKSVIEDKKSIESNETVQEIGIVEEDIKQHIEDVVEESGVPKENVVIASVSKPKPISSITDKELQDRIKQIESELDMELIGGMFSHKHPKINLKWPLNHIEKLSEEEFDKAMADNLTIMNCRLSDIENQAKTEKESKIQEIKKEEKVVQKSSKYNIAESKKEVPKAVEKKVIPIASEKTAIDFQVVDQIIGTLTEFKRTTYCIAKIKEILKSEEKDSDKIALIQNAVQNI